VADDIEGVISRHGRHVLRALAGADLLWPWGRGRTCLASILMPQPNPSRTSAKRTGLNSRSIAAEGVQTRHRSACPARLGGTCRCAPSFQAQVWSVRDRRPIRRTFPTLAEAKAWRQEALLAARRGRLRAPTAQTVADAAEEWLRLAVTGVVRTRSGDPYKPSAIRTYRMALRAHILPHLGHVRLSTLTRLQVQAVADDLVARGAAPSTVRNAILPLRAIYRRAHHLDHVAENPTRKLLLPAVRGRRDRVARPDEADRLIQALPPPDQALWATALYAGLRRGELQALQWHDIDFDHDLIHVRRSWDRVHGPIPPKSTAGTRRVPLAHILRRYLITHQLQHPDPRTDQPVFPGQPGRPFDPTTTIRRAHAQWRTAGLHPILPHECRHTYAAFMIAAGINPKALQTYMGHASITITLDRYGHLLPGNETHAATLLGTYLTAHQEPASQNKDAAPRRR
jgi:integrase